MAKKHKKLSMLLRLLLLGLLFSFMMIFFYITQPRFIKQMDNSVYDLLLRESARDIVPDPEFVVVDIDEASLNAYGQWPWPRYMLAELLTTVTDGGAKAIGVDILMIEADRTSPDIIAERMNQDLGLNIALEGIPAELENYDTFLGNTLKRLPVALGFFMLLEGNTDIPQKLPRTYSVIEQSPKDTTPPSEYLSHAGSATLPLDVLTNGVQIGFTNAAPDFDGVIRNVPLLVRIGERIYPSLALATFMKANKIRNLVLESDTAGLKSIKAGKFEIPIGDNATFRVPFIGPAYTYEYYSAGDVMSNRLPKEIFDGKTVFVGSSATGLQDIRVTPFDRLYPGVEVHLSIADAIKNSRSIIYPVITPAIQVFAILIAAMLSALVFGLARPVIYMPVGIAMVATVVFASRWIFTRDIYISPMYVIVTIAVEAVLLVCLRFWQEESHKRFIKSAFGRYVAPEVVDSIAQREDDFLSGQKRELTILFSDLRGFTTLSETLDPQQVVTLLNDYFTPMTAIVRATGGTLDKFIGDALMAFWNAPLDVENHAVKAVESSLKMQKTLYELNDELEAKYGLRLKMGIGLHTGTAYVGNMGSVDLLNYTVIGDNVNLASRLESLSKTYGQNLLVSEDTARACAGTPWFFMHLDSIRVKGKQQAVNIYTPLSEEYYNDHKDEIVQFGEAQQLYASGDFPKAKKILEQLLTSQPEHVLYSLYLERCDDLIKFPQEGWDGSWTFITK